MRSKTHFALLPVLTLIAGLLAVFVGASPAQAADRDCSDFATQRAAQLFFLDHSPSTDPHRLDADGDRIVCESNPCPCLYTKTSGGGDDTSTGTRRRIQFARVVKVTDGDTIKVRLAAGGRPDVRLVGIDTPEVYGGVECGGRAASRSLKQLLPLGSRVKLVSDPSQANKDRYGRLLRYVIRTKTGKDVNRVQVWRGNARVYVYNSNPFNRVTSYRLAQRQAKAAPRGIWRSC